MARNVQVLKQIYVACGRGDVGSVLVLFDVGVVCVGAEMEDRAARGGRSGAAAVGEELFGAVPERFETFALQLEDFIDGIDTVVATGRLTKGAETTPSFVHVWQLRDGVVTQFGTYRGMAEAMRALGGR